MSWEEVGAKVTEDAFRSAQVLSIKWPGVEYRPGPFDPKGTLPGFLAPCKKYWQKVSPGCILWASMHLCHTEAERSPTIGSPMDAFQRAVDDARRHLGISVSELLRRAGFPERSPDGGGLTIKGARYHLEPGNNAARKGGHRIPAELVNRLAVVLPIEEEELRRAAHVAAGFTVEISDNPDLPMMLARYLGDEEVTDEEKAETAARLLKIIADRRPH